MLNKNKLGFVKFWKIIQVFAQGKGLKFNSQKKKNSSCMDGSVQATASME